MSDEWKDRVIRGGAIAMGVVAGIGCVSEDSDLPRLGWCTGGSSRRSTGVP